MIFFTNQDLKILGISNVNEFIKKNMKKKSVKVYRQGNGVVKIFFAKYLYKFKLRLNKKVVDTTGCGDAFNASFIFHFFKNNTLKNCVNISHNLAKKVAYNKGALIPKNFFTRKDYTK